MPVKRLMVVTEAFSAHDLPMVIQKGEVYEADDPLVKRYAHFFGPVQATARPSVEQATAAPGERRGE